MFLGIDLGTSSAKAPLVDGAQRVLADASAPLAVSHSMIPRIRRSQSAERRRRLGAFVYQHKRTPISVGRSGVRLPTAALR